MNAREKWLVDRRGGIGGSDAAAALGQSSHKTAFQLFQEKKSLIEPQIIGLEAIERVEFGALLEAPIAAMYERRYGVKLRRHPKIIRHRKYPWMLGSLDRTIIGKREGVEIKNVDSLAYRFGAWGPEHSDVIPAEYTLQTMHYMALTGYERWHLAACVGGNRLVVYHVERDEEMIEMLIEGEHEFWQYVERNEPPPLDYTHPTAIDLLKRMYPGSDGSTVRLDATCEGMHHARLEFEELAKTMQAGADAAKAFIMHRMGNAALGTLPNGGAYRRKLVERKGYEVEPMQYIDFRYTKKGE